jgi:hypothetical protein
MHRCTWVAALAPMIWTGSALGADEPAAAEPPPPPAPAQVEPAVPDATTPPSLVKVEGVRVPGTGVVMPKLDGFTPAPDFFGLDGPVPNSLIEVVIREQGFTEDVVRGLRADLRRESRSIDVDRPLTLDGLPARIILDRGSRSGVAAWFVCAGDSERTLYLRAEIPAANAEKLGPLVQWALLNTKWDRSGSTGAFVPVAVRPAAPLKVAAQTPTGFVFTTTGRPTATARDTTLSVFMAREAVPLEDRAEFGVRMLAEHAPRFQVMTPSTVRVREVEINGLHGYETLADADIQGESGIMKVFLTILYTPTRHFVALGRTAAADGDEMIPAFRDTLATLEPVTLESAGIVPRQSADGR